jgi:hypothetical protein
VFPDYVKEHATLVCPESELSEHLSLGRTAIATPDSVKGIAATRQWIVENCETEQLMMCDDDQGFGCRRDGESKTRKLEDNEYQVMFDDVVKHLKTYNAVGIPSSTISVMNYPKVVLSPGRMFNMYAFNKSALLDNDIRFDVMPVMEDFHVTLSLLKLGMPNAILLNWHWTSGGSNAKGGCSTYRTREVQREGALKLAELHSPFVRVVEKESKSWGGELSTRTDVRVAWKKALESAGS